MVNNGISYMILTMVRTSLTIVIEIQEKLQYETWNLSLLDELSLLAHISKYLFFLAHNKISNFYIIVICLGIYQKSFSDTQIMPNLILIKLNNEHCIYPHQSSSA